MEARADAPARKIPSALLLAQAHAALHDLGILIESDRDLQNNPNMQPLYADLLAAVREEIRELTQSGVMLPAIPALAP